MVNKVIVLFFFCAMGLSTAVPLPILNFSTPAEALALIPQTPWSVKDRRVIIQICSNMANLVCRTSDIPLENINQFINLTKMLLSAMDTKYADFDIQAKHKIAYYKGCLERERVKRLQQNIYLNELPA